MRFLWCWDLIYRFGVKGHVGFDNSVARFVVFDATKTCLIHDPEEIMAFFGDVLVN